MGSYTSQDERRCPICGTVMDKPKKSIKYKGILYSLPFPIYLCMAHYHGYFRWMGPKKGHVRFRLPRDLKKPNVRAIGPTDKVDVCAESELVTLKCPDPDCGFEWEELTVPHDKTFCHRCGYSFEFSPRRS